MEIDTLVIGATFWGIGYSAASRGNTLIVDRCIRPGSEFSGSYHHGAELSSASEFGQELLDELVNRNVVGHGRFPILSAYAPILSLYAWRKNLKIWLNVDFIDTGKTGHDYSATLCGQEGRMYLKCKSIIDTTSAADNSAISKKFINAMIYGQIPITQDNCIVIEDENRSISYLRYPVDISDSWQVARHKLISYWNENPVLFRNSKIVAIGDEFFYVYNNKAMQSPAWQPSASFPGIISAFEAGFLKGSEA